MNLEPWVDLVSRPTALDWIGFILGSAGIGFTVWQLVRSRGALKAAEKALRETRSTLIKNQLISALPAFREIGISVDAAVGRDDRSGAQAALEIFCVRAYEVVSLLQSTTDRYGELTAEILGAAELADSSRADLFGRPGETVYDIVGLAADGIRTLVPKLSGASVDIRNDPGGEIDA